MSYPRADLPPSAVIDYRELGAVAASRKHGCHWQTLRRWLVDRGEPIRPQGLRFGRQLVKREAAHV
jgi:hypothetical protein